MLGKVFVGNRVSDLDTGEKTARISRVNLVVGGELMYTAGDDSGRTIEKTCLWGTQAMADSILASLRDVEYQPFSGTDGLLDPAAELGDGVTAGGVYSVLAKSDVTFDGLYSADIAAPGGDEVEEYPYTSRAQRQEARELAKIRSSITKTAESITLAVENEIAGLSGRLELTASRLTAEITNTRDGLSAELELTDKRLTTKINDTEKGLNSKIEQTASSLTTKIGDTEKGLNSKIEQTTSTLTTKINDAEKGLNSKIEQTAASLTSKINDTESSLSSEIKQTTSTLTAKINDAEKGLNSKIEQTAASLTTKIGDTQSSLSSEIKQTTSTLTAKINDAEKGLNSKLEQTASSLTAEINKTEAGLRGELELTAESLTSQISTTDGRVSALMQTVDGISSTVNGLDGQISTIKQYVDNISLSVENGSTSSTIKLNSGSVNIASQTIEMSGLVTFKGLADGETRIDGACIQTGTISADRLDLTGAITFNSLSEDVQTNISGAYSMASDANEAINGLDEIVNSLDETVGAWTYRGTTYIDGDKIMAGTVMASKLMGGTVLLLDEDEDEVGGIDITWTQRGYGLELYTYRGGIRITTPGNFWVEAEYGTFGIIDTGIVCGNHFVPQRSSYYDLGGPGLNWKDIYADNDTIITSDRNKKKDISYDLSAYGNFFDALRPVSYRRKDGQSGRTHLGLIAQDVEQALADCGLTSTDFAGLIKSPREDGGYDYALRYGEFISMMIWKYQMLTARVAEVERRIAA